MKKLFSILMVLAIVVVWGCKKDTPYEKEQIDNPYSSLYGHWIDTKTGGAVYKGDVDVTNISPSSYSFGFRIKYADSTYLDFVNTYGITLYSSYQYRSVMEVEHYNDTLETNTINYYFNGAFLSETSRQTYIYKKQ